MMNPAKLFKVKGYWDKFANNHPKFVAFLNAAQRNVMEEGTIVDIKITTAEGKTLSSNVKLSQADVEMFREMAELFGSK